MVGELVEGSVLAAGRSVVHDHQPPLRARTLESLKNSSCSSVSFRPELSIENLTSPFLTAQILCSILFIEGISPPGKPISWVPVMNGDVPSFLLQLHECGSLSICRPEQAKRVEGSSHLRNICAQIGAKILRLRASPCAQDDRLVTLYEFAVLRLSSKVVPRNGRCPFPTLHLPPEARILKSQTPRRWSGHSAGRRGSLSGRRTAPRRCSGRCRRRCRILPWLRPRCAAGGRRGRAA